MERVRYVADAVVPCDGSTPVLRPGVVEVSGGTVTHVGPAGSPGSEGPVREVRVRGALLPGLVNVHCHSPMTLFRGSGEGLPLQQWLGEVLWPQEAHLTEDDVFWGMTLAAAELLRFGVTTTCEAYFFEDAVADAVVAAGSRALVTPGVLQLPGHSFDERWWDRRIAEIVDFHARRHGDHDRIEVGFAPHAAYTVPLPVLADIAAVARGLDALFHIHLAETEQEGLRFAAEHGRSVPSALAGAGVLGGRVLAAPASGSAPRTWPPTGSTTSPWPTAPRATPSWHRGRPRWWSSWPAASASGWGRTVPRPTTISTCGRTCGSRPCWPASGEMDAGALTSAAALDLATRGAGLALGRPDLGVVAVGGRADMMAVSLDDPVFVPWLEDGQLVDHLVWAGSSRLVTDVWVAGRQVVEGGRCTTVDVERAGHEVEVRARRLRQSVA